MLTTANTYTYVSMYACVYLILSAGKRRQYTKIGGGSDCDLSQGGGIHIYIHTCVCVGEDAVENA